MKILHFFYYKCTRLIRIKIRTYNTGTKVLKYQNDLHQDCQDSFHCQLTKQLDYENCSVLIRNDDDHRYPSKNQKWQYLLNLKVYLTIAENML